MHHPAQPNPTSLADWVPRYEQPGHTPSSQTGIQSVECTSETDIHNGKLTELIRRFENSGRLSGAELSEIGIQFSH